MKTGNQKQMNAYKAIDELRILEDLRLYKPVLCGTIPIGIDVESSDLDIIMEVKELKSFQQKLYDLYGRQHRFTLEKKMIRERQVVKANFMFKGFMFELFGQDQPVHNQNAYLHTLIEDELLRKNPPLKNQVITLKKRGYKTESAFCVLLGISGDPYAGLIRYGIEEGIIKG
ncbi:DUF4269 domain-containing protein [Bacillus marinisedimentorum]|uniref:DUF4269 domain-containing protein n=1 Tax=Bacillus marinisedimentorum TaxID=1821260 RepID=UPI0008726E5A|nr:DUF4269 domain-containing protein [Bacillus marinisedimentorum]